MQRKQNSLDFSVFLFCAWFCVCCGWKNEHGRKLKEGKGLEGGYFKGRMGQDSSKSSESSDGSSKHVKSGCAGDHHAEAEFRPFPRSSTDDQEDFSFLGSDFPLSPLSGTCVPLARRLSSEGLRSRALRRGETLPRPLVFFSISLDSDFAGNLIFELFSDVVPITSENFRCLCTGELCSSFTDPSLSYKNSVFHRVIPQFMCQFGDTTKGNGYGGKSIYGPKFDDENFKLKHDEPFLLTMANAGRDTNGSQVLLTLAKCEWLDGKHVVFGRMIKGEETMQKIVECGNHSGRTAKDVTIMNCGQIWKDKSLKECCKRYLEYHKIETRKYL